MPAPLATANYHETPMSTVFKSFSISGECDAMESQGNGIMGVTLLHTGYHSLARGLDGVDSFSLRGCN